jgi:hypothetical protein
VPRVILIAQCIAEVKKGKKDPPQKYIRDEFNCSEANGISVSCEYR